MLGCACREGIRGVGRREKPNDEGRAFLPEAFRGMGDAITGMYEFEDELGEFPCGRESVILKLLVPISYLKSC